MARDASEGDKTSLLCALHVDGDTARLIVAANGPHTDQLTVISCREGLRSDLSAMVDSVADASGTMKGSRQLDVLMSLSGDDVLHDVHSVPPQVRSFDETVRLDAVLAGSQWGNVAAVSASGYIVGHAFRRDQCLLAVAQRETLREVESQSAQAARVSTDAFGILSLMERVRPDLFEPAAGSTLAILCCSTSVAMCAVSDGVVRLLFQASLLGRLRSSKPSSASNSMTAASADELEFEFAGSYSLPDGVVRAQPVEEIRASEIESSAYQTALLTLIDEALGLASESHPFTPDNLLVTGDAVHRHAVAAYLRNCFGSSVVTDELDSALAVRIDEPGLAREIAAQQAQYAGALAVLAAATSRSPLKLRQESPVESSATSFDGKLVARSRLFAGASPALLIFLTAAVFTAGGIGTGRWVFESRRHAAVTALLAAENEKLRELSAIAEEWKVAEARLVHTRALLDTINGHRQRQQTPPRLLATLRSLLPSDARLTEIAFTGGIVKVSGYCEARDIGATVAVAMEQNRQDFVEVTPQTNTAKMKLADPNTGEEVETSVHTFTIAARYVGGTAR